MDEKVFQKVGILESKLSVEKQELLTKCSEIREELISLINVSSTSSQDIELKCMSNLELFRRR